MLKKRITYTDFDGVERTEEFYFNLTEQELVEWNLMTAGGVEGFLKAAVDAKRNSQLAELFKKLIMMAYGVKSADGRKFEKNDAVREDFASTQAFSDLYIELISDADKASEFFNGIMPKKVQQQAALSVAK